MGTSLQMQPYYLLPTPKEMILGEGGYRIDFSEIQLQLPDSFRQAESVICNELEAMGYKKIAVIFLRTGAAKQELVLVDASLQPDSLEHNKLMSQVIPEQSYLLSIEENRIKIVALSAQGALYGLVTLGQLLLHAADGQMACLRIADGPDVERRVISPTLTWYAGFARVGFGTQLWDGAQWKGFMDWCFRHKINALNIVMYGFWPFDFPAYPETELKNIKVSTWANEIKDWLELIFTHPNITKPFLTEMIAYANLRGIACYAYIGLNSYSGGYPVVNPDSRMVLSAELKHKGHVNNYDSMCPSRPEVREYLIASVQRIEAIGFNGLVFEESEEVQWFCQCELCRMRYGHLSSNDAKHTVSIELIKEYRKVLQPDTLVGIRWLREPPIVKSEAELIKWNGLPKEVKLFWAPGLEDDDQEFLKWVRVFGRERIYARNCEGSGFAASLGRIPYLIPDQFPDTLKDYAFQHLWNDIAQFQGAANQNCHGINGYGFEWYGHEHYFMATAQYGWDCWRFNSAEYLEHASKHLFGEDNGKRYERVIRQIPCIHETQICETLPSFPFMPNKYTGQDGLQYLGEMAPCAEEALMELKAILSTQHLTEIQHECAQATFLMAQRMQQVIKAGIYYNRFRESEKQGENRTVLKLLAEKALFHAELDYQLIKDHYFDTKTHTWTGIASGEYYIPEVINEYKKVFHSVLGDEFLPDPDISPMVGGESLPWEWLLEWGPRIAKSRPTAAIRR